jgi:hypothetical protein
MSKTRAIMNGTFIYCLGSPGKRACVVSASKEHRAVALRSATEIARLNEVPIKRVDNTILFENGSRIVFKALGDDDPLFGVQGGAPHLDSRRSTR